MSEKSNWTKIIKNGEAPVSIENDKINLEAFTKDISKEDSLEGVHKVLDFYYKHNAEIYDNNKLIDFSEQANTVQAIKEAFSKEDGNKIQELMLNLTKTGGVYSKVEELLTKLASTVIS